MITINKNKFDKKALVTIVLGGWGRGLFIVYVYLYNSEIPRLRNITSSPLDFEFTRFDCTYIHEYFLLSLRFQYTGNAFPVTFRLERVISLCNNMQIYLMMQLHDFLLCVEKSFYIRLFVHSS